MSSGPRGIAVIISNRYFTIMADREGTMYDANMLSNLFTQLKFEVEEHDDLADHVSPGVNILCRVKTGSQHGDQRGIH